MLPASYLRKWGVLPGPGEPWFEALVPLQYAPYPLRDTAGRPLGEGNAPTPTLAGVPIEIRPCPYPGSRAGLDTNVTALRRVRDDWPWVLASVAALRASHGRPGERLDPPHLWSFAAAATSLPTFLLRTGGATDGTVPAEVSSLFKVMQGVYIAAWGLWMAEPDRAEPVAAYTVLDAIVAGRTLHNAGNGRVCPAPEGMIRELLEVCCAPAGAGDPAADRPTRYGLAWAALTLEKCLLGQPSTSATPALERHRDRLAGWRDDAPAQTEDRMTALQAAACSACGVEGPEGRFDRRWIPSAPPPPNER